MKRITSRRCGGVRERRFLSLVRHPEEHRKGDTPTKGYRVSSLCWVASVGTGSTISTWSAMMEEHLEKRIMRNHPE